MKILGLIPARSGSKGVPGKNTKALNGKPLIQYTIEKSLQSKHLHTTLVSTDTAYIANLAISLGATAPFIRPSELALDHSPTLSVVQHTLSWCGSQKMMSFDAVCLLQPTYPFRPNGFIDKAIDRFIESGADSLISVLPVPHEFNPHWVFEPSGHRLLKIVTGESTPIARRQDLPPAFFRDGAIYLTKTKVIMEQNSLYGKSIAFIESDPTLYVNIDTLEDWERAEKIATKLCVE